MTVTGLLGVPLAFHYPQDTSVRTEAVAQAPRAVRTHGLAGQLSALSWPIVDFGDVAVDGPPKTGVFRDLAHSYAIMEEAVFAVATQCDRLVVLGGSCSIAAATLSAMRRLYPRLHVLWFDTHFVSSSPSRL